MRSIRAAIPATLVPACDNARPRTPVRGRDPHLNDPQPRSPLETALRHRDQSPSSVPAALDQVRDALRNWGPADLADDSALVLSELLSNAVEHSRNPGGRVRTRFSRLPAGCGVRIEVLDADADRLPRLPSEVDDEDVRGRSGRAGRTRRSRTRSRSGPTALTAPRRAQRAGTLPGTRGRTPG
ncbi:ATP-binding protein [Streptomyces sp. NBC_01198]|uniref:ATP-binding protein n=1 Tax=Streptomyces sp. NBC_01198 TaxID=2903769 RepID=UPI003FA3790C